MLSRSNTIFIAIFALAILSTILLFTVGSGWVSPSASSGKLSPDIIKLESDYVAFRTDWLENEKVFVEARINTSQKLTAIHQRITTLSRQSDAVQAISPEEKEALPHLVGSIKAAARMVEPYVIRLMAPDRIGPAQWEKKNEAARESNSEWDAWQRKSVQLSR